MQKESLQHWSLDMLIRQFLFCLFICIFIYLAEFDWLSYLWGVLLIFVPHAIFMLVSSQQNAQKRTPQAVFARFITLYCARVLLIVAGLVMAMIYVKTHIHAVWFVCGMLCAVLGYIVSGFKRYYIIGE